MNTQPAGKQCNNAREWVDAYLAAVVNATEDKRRRCEVAHARGVAPSDAQRHHFRTRSASR